MQHRPMALLLAISALLPAGVLAADGQGATSLSPKTYAETHGCKFTHPSRDSYSATTRLLKHEQPVGSTTKSRINKWATCVATREKAHAVHVHVRKLWQWRHSYAHVWPIHFNSEDAGWRGWADSTADCESGGTMDPAIHNPSGIYHGLMQFDLGTWHEAGGSGDPHNASRAEQETRGIWLAKKVGNGRWPVCGH